ncbi:hypothetical protein D9C73_024854 [Collichthys lucidus]|uniref:Uncharacterized protein n=1 Tax=Collichthys lucidus TaxID=240159 RepID=A0A4U5VR84_COLLU|nr:hypothetical protein D9C73_024854 [Collichthys lucidus]
MREQVWASWFPRCLILIITAHTSSVSADRDLRPCDEPPAGQVGQDHPLRREQEEPGNARHSSIQGA